ncbi:MAG: prolyl oligopeptidase family serine peptidase [Planctomycetes bacterium]|nr:prolyl oligopeptidase family serine peptidase [Planctomycetota bacterium]
MRFLPSTLGLFLGILVFPLSNCRGQSTREGPPGEIRPPTGKADELIGLFRRLHEALDEIEKGRRTPDSAISRIAPDIFDTWFPLARVKLDQAMLHLDSPDAYPTRGLKAALSGMNRRRWDSPDGQSRARDLLKEIPGLIDRMNGGDGSLNRAVGRRVTRAYLTPNDGSAQPYHLYVPQNYRADQQWPLFIFLHGYVPDTSKINPWLCTPEVLALAEEAGCLFLEPHGRRNTDFQYVGEIDVLDALEQVRRFYSVDDNRVYLFGASMGGAGVWHLAVHFPHRFAAVCPINGQVDWFAFWASDFFRYPPRERLPRHQQWMIALNNPMDLLGSLLALPVFVQQATRDHIIDPRNAERAVARLKELACPVESFLDTDPAGHFIYWDTPVYRRSLEKLGQHRLNRAPRRIQHHTYSLRFPTAYWATIDRMETWGSLARLRAEVRDQTIEVKTENVLAYHLILPQELVPDGASVRLISNGEASFEGPLPADRTLRVGKPSAPGGLVKSSRVCGPLPDAFNFPFTVVRGTSGNPAENQEVDALVDRFLTDWWAYSEGLPPVKKDAEVSEEDIRSRNLVLFGRPHTNAFLARIAPQMPVQIGNDFFQIAGQKFSGPRTGLALVYPNPLNPDRYVVVFSGYPWGEKRGSNHKFDLLPDFIVFTDAIDPNVDTNHALCAGFFDTQWQFAPDLTWTGEQGTP